MTTRLKREDLDRLGPIRGWNTLFRPNEAPNGNESAPNESVPNESGPESKPAGNESPTWDGIANRAIEGGYKVIEEQIRQGQRIAEQVRGYSDDMLKANNDISRMVERSLRLYTDVGYLWFELVESLLRNPALAGTELYRGGPNARSETNGANGENGAAVASDQSVEIEVSSLVPTTVTVDIKGVIGPSLAVQPLHALDRSKPPLTMVRLVHGEGRPQLRVHIPPGQPADSYSGVVVDTQTHQPRGIVSVNVREDESLA